MRPGRVALALATALLAVLLVPVAALAAWSSDGPGTTTARAGVLGTPEPTASAVTCRALRQRATLSWSALTGASAYDVDVTTSGTFPGTVTRQSATSTTLSAGEGLAATTYSVRVRAVAGNWTGSWSATTTVTLRPCLV